MSEAFLIGDGKMFLLQGARGRACNLKETEIKT